MKKPKGAGCKILTYSFFFLSLGIKHRSIVKILCLSLHHVISAIRGEEHPAQPDTSYNHVYIYQQPTLFSSATAGQVQTKPILRGWLSVVTAAPLASRTEHVPSGEQDCADCGAWMSLDRKY